MKRSLDQMWDEDVTTKNIPMRQLDEKLGDHTKAVEIRRMRISRTLADPDALAHLPYREYDYTAVYNRNCESPIGYGTTPIGVAGPLLLDGREYQVPLKMVEGALVAFPNRGMSAIRQSGGVESDLYDNGMTRAPVITMDRVADVKRVRVWIEERGFPPLKAAFDSTSRYAQLVKITCRPMGHSLYLRFKATTGDAMGMNMVSKGVDQALQILRQEFPDIRSWCVSGNYCTDKKATAVNWLQGRGKSVNCDVIIPQAVLKDTLKVTAEEMAELNVTKNLVGTAMAGCSVGGFSAQAANIVSAIFAATGQDNAQTITSSNCLTQMKVLKERPGDLYVSVTMPSIEVGTVGGGTHLSSQSACLKMLGGYGEDKERPGKNAETLARVVAASVLAGELSLMASLAEGTLVQSHMKLNRYRAFV